MWTIKNRIGVAVLAFSIAVAALFAESTAERALRVQVETLTKQLASTQANTRVAQAAATKERGSLREEVQVNAQNAEATAIEVAKAAKENAAAVQASVSMSDDDRADARIERQGQNRIVLLTLILGFMTTILTMAWKGYTDARDRRWLREDMAAKQAATTHLINGVGDTVLTLEKNTNSIMAELLRLTAERERVKGRAEGRAEAAEEKDKLDKNQENTVDELLKQPTPALPPNTSASSQPPPDKHKA